MTSTRETLLPCPFCGGTPKMKHASGNERNGYANTNYIECQSCFVSRGATGDSSKGGYADNSTVERRAIEAWNRRPSVQQATPEGWKPVPVEAVEQQWDGLARDIFLAFDMDCKTPRKLLDHLDRCGAEIPDWLRNETEMLSFDHVISKGTRAVIIYRAMIEASPIAPLAQQATPWISVDDRLPVCDMTPNSFGVQVLVDPPYVCDGESTMHVAFYGCRQSDDPNFYMFGKVFFPTRWAHIPAAPTQPEDAKCQD